MTLQTCEVRFDGGILRRGFWLYVWEITPPQGRVSVLRGTYRDARPPTRNRHSTGWASISGFTNNGNMLRQHLLKQQVEPERCRFRLIALGPLEAESKASVRHEHDQRRDVMAAMEKALAELIAAAGPA